MAGATFGRCHLIDLSLVLARPLSLLSLRPTSLRPCHLFRPLFSAIALESAYLFHNIAPLQQVATQQWRLLFGRFPRCFRLAEFARNCLPNFPEATLPLHCCHLPSYIARRCPSHELAGAISIIHYRAPEPFRWPLEQVGVPISRQWRAIRVRQSCEQPDNRLRWATNSNGSFACIRGDAI